MNFAKVLRTTFLTEHPQWLLLKYVSSFRNPKNCQSITQAVKVYFKKEGLRQSPGRSSQAKPLEKLDI